MRLAPSKLPPPRRRSLAVLAVLALIVACAALGACGLGGKKSPPPPSIAPDAALPAPSPIDVPAAPGSLAPRLARIPEGGTLVSWLEPVSDGVALRWSSVPPGVPPPLPAATVVSSPHLLPNASDVPGVAALGNGRYVAHWRETREPAGAGYDARVALSFDSGKTWEAAVTPHRDKTDTEHGFLAIYDASLPSDTGRERTRPAGGSGSTAVPTDLTGMQGGSGPDASRDVTEIDAGIAWLDGREAAATPEAFSAQLITTTLESGGDVGLGLEQVLDDRTCDCCPVAAARSGDVTLLAYRDRTADDMRDIAVVRRARSGEWSQPIRVHEDAWHVVGCPVNGPALDADGSRAAVAWFTASADDPRVLLSFSDDAGLTWSEPSRVDSVAEGHAVGHPGIVLLPDRSVLVTYVARRESGLVVLARRAAASIAPGPALEVARDVVGIPELARSNGDVLIAWTERAPAAPGAGATEGRSVRAARWATASLVGATTPR